MKFCFHYMTMPGLVHRNPRSPNQASGSIADRQGSSIPCLHADGVDSRQLCRYWNELSSAARRELLRIDKQTLFEQVRKNLYCSRCNGLLLEAFSQLATYSKSHQGGSLNHGKHVYGCIEAHCDRRECLSTVHSEDDVRDPSVHPWGGLTATRDGILTLLDSFLDGQPLDVIQNACDCARAKDRERELLYPDACGGGGRGWITQGIGSFGSCRGHSLKETCALHTARLSCDALVDFWSALGEETRSSLLRMKEEDFIARLMFRFESKKFCRDCRRNVLKELKELKELKRSRKEPNCTRWFCNADTAFRYEVSNTSVEVDWRECFGGDIENTYQYFEWALGSAEGNADILGFEHVGLSEGARVDGLDLSQISPFYITLRAWKHDGRCTEVSVKAHGLKGKQCVHQRLLVGDGHVTITKGDSIKQFFEYAEEVEEEEDDDGMDKNESEPENEGFRAQKHAKSPELAREFLLDAATIMFKEQVEKAFREGTARQNAHTIFVCLALNLLEERIKVAYKEISTLEKQKQLLEEEEHERQEQQQRRERKRLKEKEKKLRKKEKQKEREREKEKSKCDLQPLCNISTEVESGAVSLLDEVEEVHINDETKESRTTLDEAMCNDSVDALHSPTLELMGVSGFRNSRHETLDHFDPFTPMNNFDELTTLDSDSSSFLERSKTSRRRSRPHKGPFMEVISRRFIRRSSITSLDTMDSSQGCMKMSCTSVRETSEVVTEQVFLSTQKFHRGFVKPKRNVKSNSVESWNNRRSQQKQSGFVLHGSSKRTLYIKSKQNDGIGWVEKECLSLKGSQRKDAVVVGDKKVTHASSFVSGSSQCGWQIIKAIPASSAKREPPDQDALVGCEIISSNSFSESEKMIESDSTEGMSAGTDSLAINDCQTACDKVSPGCSTVGFITEQQHNIKVASADACHPESFAFPTSDSPTIAGVLKAGKVVAVLTGKALDDDASPSSAMSCLTDSSDGGTSCSMRTESSNFGSSCSSIDASFAEPPIAVTAEHRTRAMEHMQQGVDNGSLGSNVESSQKHDAHQAISVIERHTCPEYSPNSSAGNFLTYSRDYSCDYEHMPTSVNPEVRLLHGTSHMCHTDSTGSLPLLPTSLMPMHMPGLSWVANQCMPQPVINGGHLPFPYHLGNVYMDGFGPSTLGMQALFLPLQPAFQSLSHVMDSSCIPKPSMHLRPTRWKEQQPICEEGRRVEPLLIRDAFKENGPCSDSLIEKQSSAFMNASDAVPDTNVPSNGPLRFSLFHCGSLSPDEQEPTFLSQSEEGTKGVFKPLNMSCGRAVQQEAAAVPKKSSLPVEEYSLFAATPSRRFGFF